MKQTEIISFLEEIRQKKIGAIFTFLQIWAVQFLAIWAHGDPKKVRADRAQQQHWAQYQCLIFFCECV